MLEKFSSIQKSTQKISLLMGKTQQLVILTTEYDTPILSKEQHLKQSMETQKRTPESHSFTLE